MKKQLLPLTLATSGKEVVLTAVTGGMGLRKRLADMGLTKGATFRVVQTRQPGPCIIAIGDTRLVLGYGMARKIMVMEK